MSHNVKKFNPSDKFFPSVKNIVKPEPKAITFLHTFPCGTSCCTEKYHSFGNDEVAASLTSQVDLLLINKFFGAS